MSLAPHPFTLTWEFIKITVIPLQPTLMRISRRSGKSQTCYSQPDLIGGGLTL